MERKIAVFGAMGSAGKTHHNRVRICQEGFPMELKVGDIAPNFELPDHTGNQRSLQELLKNGTVVLFFYPKDESPGCTKEACAFRDAYEDFKEAGAEVIGISSDDQVSHQKFKSCHKLPFILLSDEGGKVRHLYGITTTLGIISRQVTFVINQGGIIRHIFNSQWNVTGHMKEAMKILKKIQVTQ